MSINDKCSIGYLLEVDFEYLEELYELHNDFPLAPEKIAISSVCFQNIVKKLLMNLK